MTAPTPKYTLILHEVRKALGLTPFEYMIAEAINHLSSKPKYPWCTLSRDKMAEFFGLSRQGTQKIIKHLEQMGLVERNEKEHLRCTELWISAVQLDGGANSVGGGVQTQLAGGANSVGAPNIEHSSKGANSVCTINNHESKHTETSSPPVSLLVGSVPDPALPPPEENPIEKVISRWNELFSSKMRVTPGRTKQLKTRMKNFALDEILKAMENMSKSPFHKGDNDRGWVADPDFLLRSDEQIDKWLQKSATAENLVPPTPMQQWQIAKDCNVPFGWVRQKAKQVMKMVETGEIEKYRRGRNLEECLRSWTSLALQKGQVRTNNEMDLMELEHDKPKE